MLIKKIYRNLKNKYRLLILKKSKGYENLALNKSILKKTVAYSKITSTNKNDINYKRTLIFLRFIKKKKFKNIIDFGGGAGYHYFISKKKFPDLNFKWFIVENRTIVKLCTKKLKCKNLFFFNSLNKIKKADIIFFSSSINYTKNPAETIKSTIKLRPKYLYFTRTPLTKNQSIKYKQISLLSENGPIKIKNEKEKIIEYENKIINIKEFEDMFKDKFVIKKKYIDQKNVFLNKNTYFNTYTYIFKKKLDF